jgi:hypothetical protein
MKIHYCAIDTDGISWYIGPCYSKDDAEIRAQSMGIKTIDVHEMHNLEPSDD